MSEPLPHDLIPAQPTPLAATVDENLDVPTPTPEAMDSQNLDIPTPPTSAATPEAMDNHNLPVPAPATTHQTMDNQAMENQTPDVPPPPYSNKGALPLPNTTPQPTPSRCPRVWRILVSIFTVFFIYSILTSDANRANRAEFELGAEGDLEVSSCRPHRPLNFGADKVLAERLGYKLVEDVPEEKVPGGGVKGGGEGGRVIVLGDVHGMYHELVSLLAKVKYNPESDYLIFAGDLISKGPDSLKVLDLARNYGAGCVRGNHEDRILLHYHQLQKKKKEKKKKHNKDKKIKEPKAPKPPRIYNADEEDNMEMDDAESEQEQFDSGYKPDFKPDLSPFKTSQLRTDQKLARKITRKQAAWLDACPLVLRMKKASNMGQVEVVHAGLIHGVRLEDQDPNAIMNMRTLDHHCHLPTAGKDGRHWADLWNRGEKRMGQDGEHTTVIYGHYAAEGLDIRPYTKGIDTDCVRGGKLSAFVITNKHQEVVSVKCRKYLTN